jgi:glycosyltransferase involved in cell wall biosynthesis
MRVAVTLEQCWHEVPGGTARAALDTVDAIAARSELGVDQVGVSAWHRSPAPADWAPSIPVRALPLPRNLLYDAWQRLRRPQVERATGPVDVVHATSHVASASRAPWVATVHDLHFRHEPGHFTPRGVSVFERFLSLVIGEGALVVCPSEATRVDCLAAGIAADRVRVVPWGTAATPARAEAVAAVRRRHHLDRPFVFFAGTVEPRKNLATLVEAFRRLPPPADPAQRPELVLAGSSGWADLPAGAGRHLGFVPREELEALYAAATVVCYPSLREGFGLPVLEAMAQGAAVVTSATTSTAEVVGAAAPGSGHEAGVLVDPLDADALAGALDALLRDPDRRARLGAAARVRAGELTWERTARGMADAYRAAAGS